MMRILIVLFMSLSMCQLNAQDGTPEERADTLATKMKNILGLNDAEKNAIYGINMLLFNQSMEARNRFSHAPDSARTQIQLVENSRDSLYQRVLSESKFLLYRQKKLIILDPR